MKEIKFRVWDKTKNKWITNKVAIDADGNAFILLDGGIIVKLDKSHIDIEFYTGLKDKNGKEIYKGDIFRWSLKKGDKTNGKEPFPVIARELGLPHGSLSEDIEEVAVVGWRSGYWNLEGKLDNERWNSLLGGSFIDGRTRNICGEVIGNIYENPELIKESK